MIYRLLAASIKGADVWHVAASLKVIPISIDGYTLPDRYQLMHNPCIEVSISPVQLNNRYPVAHKC